MANMPAVELPPPTVDIRDEVIDATEDGATPTVRVLSRNSTSSMTAHLRSIFGQAQVPGGFQTVL